MRSLPAVLLAVALLAAGAAHAESKDASAALYQAVLPDGAVPKTRLKLATPYAEAYALKSAGIARTAIERRSEDATGALGFLCGLQPGTARTGAASARGYDPSGRFLGAKLSFAFH
jgi:hypothetical protein